MTCANHITSKENYMNLSAIINPMDVLIETVAQSKISIMNKLSSHAAQRTGLDQDLVRTAIVRREELGSTGIGRGVALPHAAIAGLQSPFAMMLMLKRPIDFQAVDDELVDLVFLLLTPVGPTGQYLSILSAIARRLHDKGLVTALRGAATSDVVHALMVSEATMRA